MHLRRRPIGRFPPLVDFMAYIALRDLMVSAFRCVRRRSRRKMSNRMCNTGCGRRRMSRMCSQTTTNTNTICVNVALLHRWQTSLFNHRVMLCIGMRHHIYFPIGTCNFRCRSICERADLAPPWAHDFQMRTKLFRLLCVVGVHLERLGFTTIYNPLESAGSTTSAPATTRNVVCCRSCGTLLKGTPCNVKTIFW